MSYHYATSDGTSAGSLLQNRLYGVSDAITNQSLKDYDIDDMTLAATDINSANNGSNNYRYDAIGQLVQDKAEGIAEITWRVDGKISKITRTPGSGDANLTFDYDAMGNRIAKHQLNNFNQKEKSTYYQRDAQGNVLATYVYHIDPTTQTATFELTERCIYGSSRLGLHTQQQDLMNPTVSNTRLFTTTGNKNYELSNHLGNVLAVITDKKIPRNTENTPFFETQITSVSDFYPFGSLLEGRRESSKDYRYGFNGMEKDDEVKGDGNHIDFGARGYDPRLGRWLSLDPVVHHHFSPYSSFDNNPIYFKDSEGGDSRVTIKKNDQGGGTITLESTVYLYGPSAKGQAELANEYWKNLNTEYTYYDKDGNSWLVKLNVNFVEKTELNEISEKMNLPRDKSLKASDIEGTETAVNIGFKEGDNLMKLDSDLELTQDGKPVGDLSSYGGTSSVVSWVGPSVIAHSALHQIGITDWRNFSKEDIMDRLGQTIHEIHFIDIAEEIIKNIDFIEAYSKASGKGYQA